MVKSSSFWAAAAGVAAGLVEGSTLISATGFWPGGGFPTPDFGGTVSVFFAGGLSDLKKYGVVNSTAPIRTKASRSRFSIESSFGWLGGEGGLPPGSDSAILRFRYVNACEPFTGPDRTLRHEMD